MILIPRAILKMAQYQQQRKEQPQQWYNSFSGPLSQYKAV